MSSQKARLVRRAFECLLSVIVLALFSGVSFLNFYRTNFESLAGPSRVLRWYFVVLATAIAISLAAKAIFRSFPIHRIFLIAAVLCFMAFSYNEIRVLVSHDPIKALIGAGHFALFSIGCWAVATLLMAGLIGIFSNKAVLMPTMALVGIVYVVPATMSLARALSHPVVINDPSALALTARRDPNVYWIVLDGYPRSDVLQEFFNFDNGPFVEHLSSQLHGLRPRGREFSRDHLLDTQYALDGISGRWRRLYARHAVARRIAARGARPECRRQYGPRDGLPLRSFPERI